MPDFGLTEALSDALKAAGKSEVMRPAEQKLAAQAAKTAPQAAAPGVPDVTPLPPATPPPGAVTAPQLDPSVPPSDIAAPPAPGPASTQPAPADVASGSATSVAPPGVAQASEPVPQALQPDPPPKGQVAPANALPPAPKPAPGPTPVQEAAQRFVTANIGDFPPEKLNMSHMPNVDTMSSPDGIKAAILQVADDNKEAITAARRGVVSDEQLKGMAQDLAINSDVLKQVLSREFGTAIERPEVMLAARMVEQNQAGTLLALADKVENGTATSAEQVAFEQNSQVFGAYRTQLSGAQAEWGRGGRALSIPVGLPPEVMDHIAGIIKQNNPDREAMAAAIKLAGTPNGIANIVGGMANIPLWQRVGTAGRSLVQRTFINGILSGPPTWKTIILGNNTNLLANSADLFTAGIGRGLYGLAARLGGFPTAEEGVTISDAIAHLHGVISGTADAMRVAGRVLRTGQSMDSIMNSRAAEGMGTQGRMTTNQILPEIQNSWFGSLMRGLDAVIDTPGSRIINATDEFTKTMGYRGYLTMMSLKDIRARLTAGTLRPGDAAQAMRSMMENPSPEMQLASEDWAHRMTFQTPFPEGGRGEALSNLLNKAPEVRFILPFMRTATNIFKQSIGDRTPFGMFAARIRSQLANGGFEGDLAKSRLATGVGMASMYAWMAIHDRITGDTPADPKVRALWAAEGRTPNSVRVTDPTTGKDTWMSYHAFEPHATIASVVANIVSLKSYIHGNDEVDTLMPHDAMLDDAANHVVASIIQNTGNKTFMQGASAFSEMYNDPQRMFSMWADHTGASLVPFSGATKFIRDEQDPFMRQAYTLLDTVKNNLPTIPGVKGSKTLAARLDVFGAPRQVTGGNSILGPLSPLPASTSKKDDVMEEIQNVMEQTREVPVTMPSTRLALMGNGKGLQDGSGMRLTPQEYNDYVRMSRADPIAGFGGLTFREQLAKTMALPVYQSGTPALKVELLAQVQRQADLNGRARLFHENPDFAERMTAWTAEKNRLKFNQ